MSAAETQRQYPEPCHYQVDSSFGCGRPSVYRYPAMGGGWAYLCDEHGARHADYSEHVERGPGRGLIETRMPSAAAPPRARMNKRRVVDLASVAGISREIAATSATTSVSGKRYLAALTALRAALAAREGTPGGREG